MTSLADLKNAYNKLLAKHAPVASSAQANDAFEVYALSLVLRAARDEGANINFESTSGIFNPSPLRFRTSPGRIFSVAQDYSHATVSFPDGLSFEAHIGVYVEGLAGVLHECDVLVVDASEGEFCRRNRVHPKKSSIVLTAECKFYTGKLGIDLGRQFIGVTTDLGSEGRFFLSNADGKSVDRVLAHHKRQRFFNLTPLDPDAENQVVALFRSTFRNLRAKRR
ncbi:hypothetical protein [Burkholderia cenocepacia]|uniref:hypothetical protein n=1 Tax=Burkholderia cenocepacia TaxID=95486 RepID=UPI001BA8F981|nr:hypothetical protein [Burkholderia cenocepacia]MDN7542746.1 hypothetical protein [Burkholderia cenocepacia]QUN54586.1 hypothetical protein KEH58_17535 [Burkholderia cenocepacia]